MKCDRCGAEEPPSHRLSYFNLDMLCPLCQEDERHAPNYTRAREDEAEHTRRGVELLRRGENIAAREFLNYAGYGLREEDEAFLAARRALRRTHSDAEIS